MALKTFVIQNGSEVISPSSILQALFTKEICSVYIEGGSVTGSLFMSDQCVDLLQLFMSPRILGSGISNFNLPSINTIDQSMSFKNISYTRMGDGILFQGKILINADRMKIREFWHTNASAE